MAKGKAVTIWHNPRCGKSRETLALLRVVDGPTRAPSLPQAPPACQGEKSAAGQAVSPPATAGAVAGVLEQADKKQRSIRARSIVRTETHVFIHTYGRRKSPGYCWRTPINDISTS